MSDVEIIGEYAFASMTTLESISFNENSKLTTIGQGAFASNACLVEFTIPESVTFIDIEVFYGCEALSSVIFVDTEGWTVSRDYSSYELSSEELSSSETAANYLSDSDYTYMTWVKNSDND